MGRTSPRKPKAGRVAITTGRQIPARGWQDVRPPKPLGNRRYLQAEAGKRGAGLTRLDVVLDRLEADQQAHSLAGPAAPEDLARLEAALRNPLPHEFRELLERFGAGLFYGGHELFGPTRVMIHDIELVPDLLTIRKRLAASARCLPDNLVPFHRFGQLFHLLDARRVRREGALVLAADASAAYPDLASFLDAVVVPTAPPIRLDGGSLAEGT
jgi:hypothetical protein